MDSFIFQGHIVKYHVKDGKIITSEVFNGYETHQIDMTFSSIGELRRYIEVGGFSE